MTIVKGLTEQGSRVRVVKYEGKSRRDSEADEWHGVPIARIPRRRWIPTMMRLLRKDRPDVVYAHGFISATVMLPFVLIMRLPMVLEVHGFSDLEREKTALIRLRQMVQHSIPRLARAEVIALSQVEAEDIVAAGVAPQRRVTVAYPPIDVDAYLRPARAVRSETPMILYVGNFMPYQGIDLLLAAAPRVASCCPDVLIRIVGGSDEEVQQRRRTLDPTLTHNVEIRGRVLPDETAALYENADIVVIPRPDHPINRTTARKLGEYLASGRLIVATDVADHRLLLDEGGAGFVSDTSSAGLGDALCLALGQGKNAIPIIEQAQHLARTQFGLHEGVALRLGVLKRGASNARSK